MNLLPKPLAYAIMGLVTLVWTANFVVQFIVDGYQSDPLIHGIFMGTVGGALALSRKSGDPPPPPAPPAPTPEVTRGSNDGS